MYCQDNETGWVDWSKLKTDNTLFSYVKALISFRKEHLCLRRREELKGLDRTACGMPDVSYHGENAWQVRAEVYSRQLGVLYAGDDIGDTDCFIAYNMHWLPHDYALPSPGKDKSWRLAANTEKGVLETPLEPEDQKKIELPERSIAVLVSVKQEKKTKTLTKARTKKAAAKGGGQKTV